MGIALSNHELRIMGVSQWVKAFYQSSPPLTGGAKGRVEKGSLII